MDFCQGCGAEIPEWDGGYFARDLRCINCYNAKLESDQMRPCSHCGLRKRPEQLKDVRGQHLCADCAREAQAEALRKECAMCHHWIEDWEKKFEMPNGRFICEKCHEASPGKSGSKVCANCKKTPRFPFFAPNGALYCENCAASLSVSTSQAPLLARVVNRLAGKLR